MYGKMPGVGYEDYEDARLIVVWGANPPASGIHLVPFIKRGARARRHARGHRPAADQARARRPTCTCRVRPGTDLPVALALINDLFERGARRRGVPRRPRDRRGENCARGRAPWTFERAAAVAQVDAGGPSPLRRPRTRPSTPAVIRCGWGLERNRNGGNAVLAVLALPGRRREVRRARRRLHDEQLGGVRPPHEAVAAATRSPRRASST